MRGHRIEGADKVRGRALFVDDLRDSDLGFVPLIALAVTSPVGSGTVRAIRSADAFAIPGVRAVITHENAPRLRKVISPCRLRGMAWRRLALRSMQVLRRL
jgi:xanthine dehydrogenase YagR molybdenum-binding subunit